MIIKKQGGILTLKKKPEKIEIVIPETKINNKDDINSYSVFPAGIVGDMTSYRQSQSLNPNPTSKVLKTSVDKIVGGIPKIDYGRKKRGKKNANDESANVIFSPYNDEE